MADGAVILFPGCLISTRYPQVEATARFVLQKLGTPMIDGAKFVCCPDPVMYRSHSKNLWLTIAGRNLASAQKISKEAEIVPLCSGCNTTLSEAVHILSNDDDAKLAVNKRLEKDGLKLEGEVSVRHFIRYLESLPEDRLKSPIKQSLEGLRVACFYGCHLLKPSAIMKPDSVRYPQFMERLVRLLGATPLNYDSKASCCGKGSLDDEVALDMTKTIVERIMACGAIDAIACACPFCFSAFESYLVQEKIGLPVLFISQLFALAYGAPPEILGKGFHRVKIDGILDRYLRGEEKKREEGTREGVKG